MFLNFKRSGKSGLWHKFVIIIEVFDYKSGNIKKLKEVVTATNKKHANKLARKRVRGYNSPSARYSLLSVY